MYEADGESQQNVNVLLNQNNLFRYVETRGTLTPEHCDITSKFITHIFHTTKFLIHEMS